MQEQYYKEAKRYYAGRSVVVTGGAGFIGSHLSEKLVEFGARVTILDDLSTGDMANIEAITSAVRFIHGSIVDFDVCTSALTGADVVFHLAACVSVVQSMEHPDSCYATNVTGTLNLLEAGKRLGLKRLVLSSSSAVYGLSDGVCSEESPCFPLSPYGMSKLIAERACTAYAADVETVRLRYFNVYGERQNPAGDYAAVVPKFRSLMAQDKPITIFGDGLQTRDFVSVSEVVDANIRVGMLESSLVNGSVFNIARGTSVTLLDLVNQLKEKFPSYDQPITFLSAREGDIRHSTANCSRWQRIKG